MGEYISPIFNMNKLDQKIINAILNGGTKVTKGIKIPIDLIMIYDLGLIDLISDVIVYDSGWYSRYKFIINSDIFIINSERRFSCKDWDYDSFYLRSSPKISCILNALPNNILNKIAANEVQEFMDRFDAKHVDDFFNKYKDNKLIKLFNEYKLFS